MDSDVLRLFIDFPGNLLYFLVLIGVSQAAFFIALGQRLRQGPGDGAARLAAGAAGATLGWAALMLGALLTLSSGDTSSAILPALDRAVNTWVLLWCAWAFLSAGEGTRARRWLDLGLGVLLALLLLGYAATANAWGAQAAGTSFNESAFALPWTVVPVALCMLGVTLSLLSYGRARDVPLKLLFFAVLIAGYGVTLGQLTAGDLRGDYAGGVRLGMLAALPVFLAIVYRYVIEQLTAPAGVGPEEAAEPEGEAPARAARPLLEVEAARPTTPPAEAIAVAMELMIAQDDPRQVPYQIALGVATALKADVVAVLSLTDTWADVLAAYDHIRQQPINGLALNLEEQPTLRDALAARQPAVLLPPTRAAELADLYARLDVTQTGPAYFQPLVRAEHVTGLILVALPYSGRQLQPDERRLLEELASIAAGLLSLAEAALEARFAAEDQARPAVPADAAAQSAREELLAAREQIGELTDMVRALQIELDYERSRLAERELDAGQALTLSQQMEALRNERAQLAAERDRLHAALAEAQTTLSAVAAGDNVAVLRGMVEVLTREKEELEAQRDTLRAQLEQLTSSATAPDAIAQILQSLTEETERLAAERDQISAELRSVNAQLEKLGVEGGTAGLAQWLGQLYDERARLIEQNRQLLAEREEALGAADLEGRVLLREQVKRLANEREALAVQRDALRREREEQARQLEEAQARLAALTQAHDQLAGQLATAEANLKKAGMMGVQLGRQRDELQQKLAALTAERDQLVAERVALVAERDRLRASLEGAEKGLSALESVQVELQSVQALRDLVAELSQQRAALEAELAAAREDVSYLQGQLQATEEQLRNTEAAVDVALREVGTLRRQPPGANAEVIASIAQELRTPMSSIMGYTDLILSESVGILGAMQRNFLQRVKANTERMGALLDDLIRITVMESGRFELAPETVDAVEVIEEAIMGAGSQFREKDLTLRMDIADDLPTLHADRDALQQIMTQLIANACQASPVHGEVVLTARREHHPLPGPGGQERRVECLFVAVKDTGGGVAPADLERVFSRKYRADNPLVEGLGDTGVGLSIAKALVEAHGGRIWLESIQGEGSTFCFALPLQPVQQEA